MELILFAIAILLIGALAGLLAGLLGVGGGIVLVPAYFYAFRALGYGGEDLMRICVATSLATIIVTSLRSLQSHHRKGAVEWGVLRGFAPWIVAGAIGGMLAATALDTRALQLAFGGLGLLVGTYMALGTGRLSLGAAMPTGAPRAGYGAATGFLSVLMGIGGGSFGVPLMTLYGMPIHRAVATAAGFGVVIAVPSVIGFLLAPAAGAPPWTVGSVNAPAFALTIVMTLLTAPLGAALAHRMNPRPLKRVFAVFLLLVAANMLFEALTGA
ncbi:putative membrane protein YfcA [Hasllibacter halocynthiae]|uniref:Probable membrane transporter protein n=1 Tax=Hasllibacter halocynthiae TaxID=595589 RepID=A0A2T0X931_9RHOB|nr:sulfite exporter TauE/SafE family protein [Hasllibacter halocynthiae]PRY95427.1 putative membrane protein YfcA [Hasllibacter halocynthiae]